MYMYVHVHVQYMCIDSAAGQLYPMNRSATFVLKVNSAHALFADSSRDGEVPSDNCGT